MSQTEVSLSTIIEAVRKWTQYVKAEHTQRVVTEPSDQSVNEHTAILQFFDHCVDSFPELMFKEVSQVQTGANGPSTNDSARNLDNLAVLWFLRHFLEIRKYFPLHQSKSDAFVPTLYGVFKKYFVAFRKKHFALLQQWAWLLYLMMCDLVNEIETQRPPLSNNNTTSINTYKRCYSLTIGWPSIESCIVASETSLSCENTVESPHEMVVERLEEQLAVLEVVVVQLVTIFEVEPIYLELIDVNDAFLCRCFANSTFLTKVTILKCVSLKLPFCCKTRPQFIDCAVSIVCSFVEYTLRLLKNSGEDEMCCESLWKDVCRHVASVVVHFDQVESVQLYCNRMTLLFDNLNDLFLQFATSDRSCALMDELVRLFLTVSPTLIKFCRSTDHAPFVTMARSLTLTLLLSCAATKEPNGHDSPSQSCDVTDVLSVAGLCNEISQSVETHSTTSINSQLNRRVKCDLKKCITKLSEHLILSHSASTVPMIEQLLIVYWLNICVMSKLGRNQRVSESSSTTIINLLNYVQKFDSPYAVECALTSVLFVPIQSFSKELLIVVLNALFNCSCLNNKTALLILRLLTFLSKCNIPTLVITHQFLEQHFLDKLFKLITVDFLRLAALYREMINFHAKCSAFLSTRSSGISSCDGMVSNETVWHMVDAVGAFSMTNLSANLIDDDVVLECFYKVVSHIHSLVTNETEYRDALQECYLLYVTEMLVNQNSNNINCDNARNITVTVETAFVHLKCVDWNRQQTVPNSVIIQLLLSTITHSNYYSRASSLIDDIVHARLSHKNQLNSSNETNCMKCVHFLHSLIIALSNESGREKVDVESNDNATTNLLEEQVLMWLVKIALLHDSKSCLGSVAHTVQCMANDETNDYSNTFDIYTKYSLQINVMVVKFALQNKLSSNMNDVIRKVIYILDRLFNPYNKHSLYAIFINETISLLVHMANEEALELLGVIADYCSCNVNEMLCKSAKHIYSYLFLHCNGEELEQSSAFIRRITKNQLELDSLVLPHDMHNVIIHLLMYLCVDRTPIMMAIAIILSMEPSHDNSTAAIKEYLSMRLYGLVAFFNNLLSHGNYMELRLAIKSLADLIELLGESHIKKVLHKLLALVKSATAKYKDVEQLGLHTCWLWRSFVQILSVDSCVAILPHISSGLLQLYDNYPDQVCEIHQMILFDKFADHPQHCLSLIAIPAGGGGGDGCLTKQNNSINENNFDIMTEHIVAIWKEQLKNNTLSDAHLHKTMYELVLSRLLMAMSSDDFELQSIALLDTTDYIRHNYATFVAYLNSGCGNQQLADIIAKVVLCCQNKQSPIGAESCRFFATMGTIDPMLLEGMLQTSMVQLKKDYQISPAGDDLTFCFELLKELCKSFVSCVDSRQQDCASYAIQEVLKFYDCSDDPKSVLKYQRWMLFDEETRHILRSHLYSRYRTKMTLKYISNVKLPVLNCDRVSNCNEWVTLWASYLMSLLPCVDLDSPSFKRIGILKACITIISQDHVVSRTLLPHTLYQVLVSTLSPSFSSSENLTSFNSTTNSVSDNDTCSKCVFEFQTILHKFVALDRPQNDANDLLFGCMQVLFDCIDFIYERLRHFQKVAPSHLNQSNSLNINVVSRLETFLTHFPWIELCKASLQCKSYVRALRYIEHDLSCQGGALTPQHADLLHHIYTSLADVDNICGVSALKCYVNNAASRISELELKKSYHDAIVWEEVALSNAISKSAHSNNLVANEHPNKFDACNSNSVIINLECGILKNFLNLYQPRTVINYETPKNTSNDSSVLSRQFTDFFDLKLDAVWRLASWDSIDGIVRDSQTVFQHHICQNDNFVSEQNENTFLATSNNLAFVKSIQSLENNQFEGFYLNLDRAYNVEAQKLQTLNTEGDWFNRNCSIFLRLHLLFDLEHMLLQSHRDLDLCSKKARKVLTVSDILRSTQPQNVTSSALLKNNVAAERHLQNITNQRLNITHRSYLFREPLLALQRLFLKDPEEIAHNYLDCARIARKSKMLDTCNTYLKHSQHMNNSLELAYERTKYYEARGDYHEAIGVLQSYLKNYGDALNFPQTNNRLHSKVSLKLCSLSEKTSHSAPQDILKNYTNVVKLNCHYEKAYFMIANYYEKLIASTVDDDKYANYLASGAVSIINHYGTSLKYGSKYLHLSLPRLIILWMDFETMVMDSNNKRALDKSTPESPTLSDGTFDESKLTSKVNELCAKVTALYKSLPSHVFLNSLSQLISRICHQNKSVWKALLNLLSFLLATYPQHTVWYLVGVANSGIKTRSSRCREVFDLTIKSNPQHSKFVTDVIGLSEKLIVICDKKSDKSKLTVTKDFPQLKKMINSANFSKISVPILSNLDFSSMNQSSLEVLATESFVTIASIEDQIAVLPSLQRPKKIRIIGNNGVVYGMMCKPKDDLRRDFRLMEFNALVNKFLNENEESHRRQLHIKLYAVVPLNDESGLIEWVEGTSCIRTLICDIYKQQPAHMKPNEIRKLFDETSKDSDRLLHLFTNVLLKNHPAVLSEWFHDTFQDHALWYMARENFSKSCAVMSMVGFILGLGDRHGENILVQLSSGAVMHVDFNCLFNKGELFAWPERVPFRLTHNMTNAMGVLGYEGAFRSCSVIVLGLMRTHKDSLITVLKTFLYDPLVEWTKATRSNQKSKKSGDRNEDAQKILDQIEKRLLGFSNQSKFQIPLNVSGQVNQLINEATDPKNLSQMFCGWAAFH